MEQQNKKKNIKVIGGSALLLLSLGACSIYALSQQNNQNTQVSVEESTTTSVVVKVDGVTISTALPAGNTLLTDYTFNKAGQNITVEVADSGGYKVSKSYTGPSSVTPESSASPSI